MTGASVQAGSKRRYGAIGMESEEKRRQVAALQKPGRRLARQIIILLGLASTRASGIIFLTSSICQLEGSPAHHNC